MIASSSKSTDIFFFNIAGQQMGSYVLDINGNDKSVNVSRWADGLYLMSSVVDGNKRLTNRYVISR